MSSALTKWSQDIIFKLATQRCLSIIWTAVVKGSQSPVKTAVFIFFFGNHKLNRTHFHKILRQGFHRLCQLNNGIFGDRVTQLFSCLSSLFKVLFLHSITCKVTWFVMSYTCVYVPCLLTPPLSSNYYSNIRIWVSRKALEYFYHHQLCLSCTVSMW